MLTRFGQWAGFLEIDDEVSATLKEFSGVVLPHMESIMDAVYSRITGSESAMKMFTHPQAMQRARERQKYHWVEYVFVGNFDNNYQVATREVGQTHYRLGVDLRLYSGAYSVVLNEVLRLTSGVLNPADLTRYLSALNRAIFLDIGLATSVYYESLVGALEAMSNEVNFALARAGEFRDNETGKHISRMSKMCRALALAIGKDRKWADMLQIASPLHDVGKIGVPDQVLLKPGRLDADELEIMRTHPGIGGGIIPDNDSEVIRMARRISLTHHEKWDGSGYPAGLRGDEIPLEGRSAAICDVYDALVSTRPYKAAWLAEDALAYLRDNRGSHFEPQLVDAFLSILPAINEIQREFADA